VAQAPRSEIVAALVRSAAGAVAVLVVYATLPVTDPAEGAVLVLLVVGLVAVGAVAVLQIRSIVRAPAPVLRAAEVVGLVVPLYLVFFALTYLVVDAQDTDAFTEPLGRIDAAYFAVTVFTTVGFGDIAPTSAVARVVVTVQMIANLVVLGLGVRLLLGAVREGLARREAG
jgi:hypothetical protein